ncbi:MAG: hypothetical protein V9G12_20315, partial [Microthrixaceae bacterium]
AGNSNSYAWSAEVGAYTYKFVPRAKEAPLSDCGGSRIAAVETSSVNVPYGLGRAPLPAWQPGVLTSWSPAAALSWTPAGGRRRWTALPPWWRTRRRWEPPRWLEARRRRLRRWWRSARSSASMPGSPCRRPRRCRDRDGFAAAALVVVESPFAPDAAGASAPATATAAASG